MPMNRPAPSWRPDGRRTWIRRTSGTLIALATGAAEAGPAAVPAATLFTFGDSVLDCGRYNDHGVDPGRLIVRNDNALFPEFRGRDLSSRGRWSFVPRAVDGATVADLPRQAAGLTVDAPSVALVSVGGNDLLRGLAADRGDGLVAFERALDRFLVALPVRPVLLANVYDPTFGDDRRNFLPVPVAIARGNHRRMNEVLGALAARHGRLVDLHRHFLTGDASWFTNTIEPSLVGASEVRRAFLERL